MKYRIVKVESGGFRIQYLPDSTWKFYDDLYITLAHAKADLDIIIASEKFDDKNNSVVSVEWEQGEGWLD